MTTRLAGIVVAVLAAVTACATEAETPLSFADGDPAGTEQATDDPTGDTGDATTERPTTSTSTTTAPPTTAAPPPGFGNGTHVVGTDVRPGRYTSEGTSCQWERLSGLSGSFDEIIVNEYVDGQAIVEIDPGDAAFSSSGCGRWIEYESPAAPVSEFGPGDWVVGEQIVPGAYEVTPDPDGDCYWESATGFQHQVDEIIANGIPRLPVVVGIPATDTRFTTTAGCGTWTPAPPIERSRPVRP